MFFQVVDQITDFIWTYPAILLIVLSGAVFTWRSRLFQVRKFPAIIKIFWQFALSGNDEKTGIHPLQAFFASLGGAIGIGNVIVVCTAVQIGGPGALFWIWVVAFIGMLLKYAEVYLGMTTRVKNDRGGYDGGPMYYLPKAFSWRGIPAIVALLLCVYGAEVFTFNQMVESIVYNWNINQYVVIAILLLLVLAVVIGGVRRVGEISAIFIPVFVVIYVILSLWVIIANITLVPAAIALVFKSAFTGHAAIGAFPGATWLVAIGQGAARGAYTGDIGVGYASVIHAESSATSPTRQASLAVFGIFLDTFIICTLSISLILLTGVWTADMPASTLIQAALSQYFPHMQYFIPFFIFLLGYSTVTAYFVFGIKAARYLSPRFGEKIYLVYGSVALVLFALVDAYQALTLMALSGALLLIINVCAALVLRKQVDFDGDL